DTGARVWLLSAKTPAALQAQARQLAEHSRAHPEVSATDIAHTLTARTRFDHRAAVIAGNREDFHRGLGALAAGQPATNLVTGSTPGPGSLALLFPGQGSQRPATGRQLHQHFPVFAAALDETCDALNPHLDRTLQDVLFAEPGTADAALLDETRYTQPALFALETALYRLLESSGIRPDYLAGHSVGELTAAHVAGVLSLADAATLVTARGRLMHTAPAGAMIAAQATEEEVAQALTGHHRHAAVAATNTPDSTVISGDRDTVAALARQFADQGRKVRTLNTNRAFHSPHMDPVRAPF